MGDDIILSTSRVEQLKLVDKTVTECEIFQEAAVLIGKKERLTEEVAACLTEDFSFFERQLPLVNSNQELEPKTKTSNNYKEFNANIGRLTEGLIDEIFARLPIKTLIQFRSLSKSWYSRIASPAFIRMFAIARSMNTPDKVLIQHATCKVTRRRMRGFICTLHSEDKLPLCPARRYTDVTSVGLPSPYSPIDVIGSCNGIICLYRCKGHNVKKPRFLLWNLSIRREVTIPDPPFMRAYQEDCEASLGFGFDPIANDYNIVGIIKDRTVHALFIYSLKTNSWREINFPTRPNFSVTPRAVLINGALHWVAKTSNKRERMILTFNLSSHVFGTILLPEPSRRVEKLTILNGCLGLISRKKSTTRIWGMREYDNVASWSLVHELDMKQFDGFEVIKALSNGCLLFDKSGFGEWYYVYYPETGVLSRLSKFNGLCRMFDMEMYVESLELIDKGTPCGEAIKKKERKSRLVVTF